MRILHIGDIVGKPGRRIVGDAIPGLRERDNIDFIIANGENCAGGSGITPENYRELLAAGIDCITLGDHIYRRKQIAGLLRAENRIVKPANYPDGAPGRPWTVLADQNSEKVAVISLMGRVFMKPVDCPFTAMNRVLSELPREVKVILVDFHAEATSDKQLMGRFLDGRVSTVLGTHTHVTTADEQILLKGTAFQCDVGMTGPHDSILGRRVDRVLATTTTMFPTAFDVAENDVRLAGTLVDIDSATGKATAIKRICVDEETARTLKSTTPNPRGLI